ncbi:hypothetical protein DBV14_09565 [Variovorax sp. KBW07]|nr:hypothetical protein DBV14_09565 [Variovorax sp. KBW07]
MFLKRTLSASQLNSYEARLVSTLFCESFDDVRQILDGAVYVSHQLTQFSGGDLTSVIQSLAHQVGPMV